MKDQHYECLFCYSKFVHESRYIKHNCKQKKRATASKTTIGISAYTHYKQWMAAYKRMVPSHDSFLTSNFYVAFMRFANQVRDSNIPDVGAFIRLMKDKDISPTIWQNNQVYAMYLEYIDRQTSPIQQAKITIRTLFQITDATDHDVSDVFDVIDPNDLIVLLRARKLSPWVLLLSPKFRRFLDKKTTPEQLIIMESIIRPKYWKSKFDKHPNEVVLIKSYIEELNI